MTKRIEVEQKFFCTEDEALKSLIFENSFMQEGCLVEKDEYFTDIDSIFVKNRTCLRLRMTDGENLELTFKGKSSDFKSSYAKMEDNISLNPSEYNDTVAMLFSLGYYSYCVVNKKRTVFSKKRGSLSYNVMLDEIEGVGSFVEFELLSEQEENQEELCVKLNEFVQIFKGLNLQEAALPYRDFVAQNLFESLSPVGVLQAVLLDLDGTLIDNERTLSKEIFLNFNLLKQLKKKKIKLGLVTTHKKNFVETVFNTLKVNDIFDCVIAKEDVENLKPSPDVYWRAMNQLGVAPNNALAIEDSQKGLLSASKSKIKTVQAQEISRVLFTLINFLEDNHEARDA